MAVEQEQELFDKLCSGIPLTVEEAKTLTPTREEFAALWRYLSARAGEEPLEDTALHLSRSVARAYGLRETFVCTLVCLEVMHEQGLIRVEKRSDHLLIRTTPPAGKVDLESSALMRRLRRSTERATETR